jgi:hypothetical protein
MEDQEVFQRYTSFSFVRQANARFGENMGPRALKDGTPRVWNPYRTKETRQTLTKNDNRTTGETTY